MTSVERPLRCAVDGGAEARGPGADDDEVSLLASTELATDAERARDLSGRRPPQLDAAREAHERQRSVSGRRLFAPGVRQAIASGELEHAHGRLGRARPDDLEAD